MLGQSAKRQELLVGMNDEENNDETSKYHYHKYISH
jgi:hypothetical protein